MPPYGPGGGGGGGTLTLVPQQIVFGSSTNGVAQDADLYFVDTTSTLFVNSAIRSDSGAPATTNNGRSLTIAAGDSGTLSGAGPVTGVGGSLTISAGSGRATAGDLILTAGSTGTGSGNANGGTFTAAGGNGRGTGTGGTAFVAGGNGGGSGRGGNVSMFAGACNIGNGASCIINASDAGSLGIGPNNGGGIVLFTGAPQGAGAAGLIEVTDGTLSYMVPNGAGAVTRGNVGPIALTIQGWFPIVVDGVQYYMELYG